VRSLDRVLGARGKGQALPEQLQGPNRDVEIRYRECGAVIGCVGHARPAIGRSWAPLPCRRAASGHAQDRCSSPCVAILIGNIHSSTGLPLLQRLPLRHRIHPARYAPPTSTTFLAARTVTILPLVPLREHYHCGLALRLCLRSTLDRTLGGFKRWLPCLAPNYCKSVGDSADREHFQLHHRSQDILSRTTLLGSLLR
jgi:hypothetical protein